MKEKIDRIPGKTKRLGPEISSHEEHWRAEISADWEAYFSREPEGAAEHAFRQIYVIEQVLENPEFRFAMSAVGRERAYFTQAVRLLGPYNEHTHESAREHEKVIYTHILEGSDGTMHGLTRVTLTHPSTVNDFLEVPVFFALLTERMTQKGYKVHPKGKKGLSVNIGGVIEVNAIGHAYPHITPDDLSIMQIVSLGKKDEIWLQGARQFLEQIVAPMSVFRALDSLESSGVFEGIEDHITQIVEEPRLPKIPNRFFLEEMDQSEFDGALETMIGPDAINAIGIQDIPNTFESAEAFASIMQNIHSKNRLLQLAHLGGALYGKNESSLETFIHYYQKKLKFYRPYSSQDRQRFPDITEFGAHTDHIFVYDGLPLQKPAFALAAKNIGGECRIAVYISNTYLREQLKDLLQPMQRKSSRIKTIFQRRP